MKIKYRRRNCEFNALNTVNKVNTVNKYGYTSILTKDTPFINYLIKRRINFCKLSTSSHIAAFCSEPLKDWCYIKGTKWTKNRYR